MGDLLPRWGLVFFPPSAVLGIYPNLGPYVSILPLCSLPSSWCVNRHWTKCYLRGSCDYLIRWIKLTLFYFLAHLIVKVDHPLSHTVLDDLSVCSIEVQTVRLFTFQILLYFPSLSQRLTYPSKALSFRKSLLILLFPFNPLGTRQVLDFCIHSSCFQMF